jgi:uncharacterized protein (TIGR02145 family)
MKKHSRIWIYSLVLMGFVMILTYGCKKDNSNNPSTTITDADGNVYTSVTTGTSHWSLSAGATNSSGFTALPGGNRESDVGFNSLGDYGYYWTATEDGSPRGWYRRLNNDNGGVHRSSSRKPVGYSVRCLKN